MKRFQFVWWWPEIHIEWNFECGAGKWPYPHSTPHIYRWWRIGWLEIRKFETTAPSGDTKPS